MWLSHDRTYQISIFVGLLLISASCSFFVLFWFIDQPTQTEERFGHHDDSGIKQTGVPAQREHLPADKQRVDADLHALVTEVTTHEEHSAPLSLTDAKQKFTDLCNIYSKQCASTLRDGSYDRIQKYLYQGLSIALMQQIDARLQTPKKTLETISYLKIYQHETDGRGSAGHTTVKINSEKIPTHREYREVLTHELGHIVDLGILQGISSKKNRSFTEFGKIIWAQDDPSLHFYQISWKGEVTKNPGASFKDFVSGYAMKGVYEDFAETQNLRFNHNLLFQKLAEDNSYLAKKYAFFKNIYGEKRFDANKASVGKVSLSERPRDTTRIE